MRFTAWENHEHNSSHTGSLTLKTFALSAVVAYLGLALSAFVYVPFGESVMEVVHGWMFGTFGRGGGGGGDGAWNWNMIVDASAGTATHGKDGRWDINTPNARQKLNPSRLQEQMFAYTVTNQVTGTFFEVGMPFILRALESFWGRARGRGLKPKRSSGVIGGKKKRVVFEDELRSMRVASGSGSGSVEHEAAGDGEKEREEREFLEVVRSEAALPAYGLFEDYSEMVTQFGYVALWSGIWPLAPGESFPQVPSPCC
jgi:hypothetical protein